MIEWTTDPDVRRRALVGLNKGEAHHALKLAAIIIYWKTLRLGDALFARRQAGARAG